MTLTPSLSDHDLNLYDDFEALHLKLTVMGKRNIVNEFKPPMVSKRRVKPVDDCAFNRSLVLLW